MTRVTITMPEDTRQTVERAAKRQGKSFSATVTELIEKQLAEQRKESPFLALIGLIDDPNLQSADIDEVLRGLATDVDDRDRR